MNAKQDPWILESFKSVCEKRVFKQIQLNLFNSVTNEAESSYYGTVRNIEVSAKRGSAEFLCNKPINL